jgi:hypothetical protein
MQAHYGDIDMNKPVLLGKSIKFNLSLKFKMLTHCTELQEVFPDESSSPPRNRKLFLARLRTTSAEERLRQIITERTQHLQSPNGNRIPRAKVAFAEK